jgi:hypothetical protein
MEKFEAAAGRIVKDYLKISQDERFFIITDRASGFPFHLSRACYDFSRQQGIEARMVKQDQISYGPADRRVTGVLKGMRKNDCLFLCLEGQLGNVYNSFGKGFRTFLRSRGVRFATMVGLMSLKDHASFLEALAADMKGVRDRGRVIQDVMNRGKSLEVIGMSGTRIKCSIDGRKAWFNSGEFFRPGQGGNLPAGDVSICPVEGSVEGRIVIDLNMKVEAETIPVKTPVELELENGEIAGIHGDKALVESVYNDLNNFSLINSRQGFDSRAIFRISEIGFGLLPGKPIGLNLMDKSLVGVCEIGNGNSWGKGGKNRCRGHRGHLFWMKEARVDGELIRLK